MVGKKLAAKYLAAVVIAAVAVYLIEAAYNQPQPELGVQFNYTSGRALGWLNNTLPYNINVAYFYCSVPGGGRYRFAPPTNDSVIGSGSNVSIGLQAGSNVTIPADCTGWKVQYARTSLTSLSSGTPHYEITVTPTNASTANGVNVSVA